MKRSHWASGVVSMIMQEDSVNTATECHSGAVGTGDGNRQMIQGLVIRKDRGRYIVQTGGQAVPCTISNALRKRLLYPLRDPASLNHYEVQRVEDIEVVDPVAIGDQVVAVAAGDGSGMIKEVLPRRSQLSRRSPGPIPLEQVLVANVDQMVAVFAAARPEPKWHLLDRYLVIAETAGIPVRICITKMDLVDEGTLDDVLELYRELGYPATLTSTLDGRGLEECRDDLRDRVSVLVGKSGVGKTSLLNAIEPGLGLRVSAVGTGRLGKGRHTTSHLELIPLSVGGGVVDTPGMRELAPWHTDRQELGACFPELRPYLGACKFGLSCQHDTEPGCAIRTAADNGEVSMARYRSYLRMAQEAPE